MNLISNTNGETLKKICIILLAFAILIASITVGLILLTNPMAIYKNIHFGWIIALFFIASIVLIILIYILKEMDMLGDTLSALLYFVSLLLIPLMIVGVSRSRNQIYEIYTPEDMEVFGNAPINYNTVFILEDDIDFMDYDVSGWFSKRRTFEGVFEGNGYTLYNIDIHVEDKQKDAKSIRCGFVETNTGVIRNLNFENCRVTLIVRYRKYKNVSMYFGIIAAYNSAGKIWNCNVVDCQAKYISEISVKPTTSLTVGGQAKDSQNDYAKYLEPLVNVNAINVRSLDEEFYEENDLKWIKIGVKENEDEDK